MTTGGEGGWSLPMIKISGQLCGLIKIMEKLGSCIRARASPGFRWVHDSFGTNWRMTEMQAAIGRIQLKRMPDWNSKRRKNAGGNLGSY